MCQLPFVSQMGVGRGSVNAQPQGRVGTVPQQHHRQACTLHAATPQLENAGTAPSRDEQAAGHGLAAT